MPIKDQCVGGIGYSLAFRWIAKAFDYLGGVRQILLERDVMFTSFENFVIAAAHQDLAGPGRCSLKMSGGDAFGIDGARRASGEETRLDLVERRIVFGQRLVPDRRMR